MRLICNVVIKQSNTVNETYKLVSKKEDCLQAKLPVAKVEEILQAWSEKLHHHHIVLALPPVVLHLGYAYSTGQYLKEWSTVT